MKFAAVAVFALIVIVAADVEHGWGKSIEWRSFEAGTAEAKTSNKPLMLIIHKTWCGACKALKPQFAASSEIAELSKKFVMVNVEDDEEPAGAEYGPDGGYIPRILFIDAAGKVQPDIINEQGNPKYRYYYSAEAQIAASMAEALEVISSQHEL